MQNYAADDAEIPYGADDSKPSAAVGGHTTNEGAHLDQKNAAASAAVAQRAIKPSASARTKHTRFDREDAKQPGAMKALRRSSMRSGSGVEEQDDATDDPSDDDADNGSQPTRQRGRNLPNRDAIERAASEKKSQNAIQKKYLKDDAEHLLHVKAKVEEVWTANGASLGEWTQYKGVLLKAPSFWGLYFIKLSSGLILFGKADADECTSGNQFCPLCKRIRSHIQLLLKDERTIVEFLILQAWTNEQRMRLYIVEELIQMMIYALVNSDDTLMGPISAEEAMISQDDIQNIVVPMARKCLERKRQRFSLDFLGKSLTVDFGGKLPHR